MSFRTFDYHVAYRKRLSKLTLLLILFPLSLFALGIAVYVQNKTFVSSTQNPYARNSYISPLASPTYSGIQVGIGGGPGTKKTTQSFSKFPSPTQTYGPAY